MALQAKTKLIALNLKNNSYLTCFTISGVLAPGPEIEKNGQKKIDEILAVNSNLMARRSSISLFNFPTFDLLIQGKTKKKNRKRIQKTNIKYRLIEIKTSIGT